MRLRIVPLDPTLHDRGAFSCGNSQVDNYLRSTAAQAAKFYRAATFVLQRVDDDQSIIGFYTLLPHEYRHEEIDPDTARALRVQGLGKFPMILLGQLGVATDYQNKKLGKYLLRNALSRSLAVAQQIGGVAVITDPYDAKARSFYAKFGFEVLHEDPFVRMLLPMRTLAKAQIQGDAQKIISSRQRSLIRIKKAR